jgi:CDP-glycerol glycerophosphotransferase (TagB/SpsB family)
VPSFTFARGNALKLLVAPLYAVGAVASLVVRRREKAWVFGSGSGLGEGSLALYRHLAATEPTLELLWLARDRHEAEDARSRGMRAARRSSWSGFAATLRARVVVVTHGFGDVNRFGTRGAFVVQLWHGIPLKRIQLDSPVTFRGLVPARMLRAAYRRQTRAIGLLPAAGEVSAERLRSAFGLPDSRVVVTGDPRDDAVIAGLGDAAAATELLRSAIGATGSTRIILYAPTWRDGEPDPGVPDAADWARIADFLEVTDSILVLRPHPHGVGAYEAGPARSTRIRMLPAAVQADLNPVLPAVDVLVTDYSSVAYDFALTGRPIAFLAPDVARYAATRGLYEPYQEFSGGTEVGTWSELLELLADEAALVRLAGHARTLADRHHAFRDGGNTARVGEEIRTRLEGLA